MPDRPPRPGAHAGQNGTAGWGDLPAASSFMSSRWSRDNLITSHPARLYDGRVIERIDLASLETLIQELERSNGPLERGTGRMGVFTWDIACTDSAGALVVQVPLVLDEPGRRQRAKRDVPRLNVENMRHFIAQGLTRFVVTPKSLVTLGGNVPAATFGALPEHRSLSFGSGSVRIELTEGSSVSLVELGPVGTAEILAEMVAALAYHYDPDTDGGTAVTDVFVNDGDFAVKRKLDGSFELRLTAARRRETGIDPSLLISYFVQLMAFEDWEVDGNLVGLPVLISNPSVAFEGLVRGLRYRYRDLGRNEAAGRSLALRWIGDFGRSRAGRAYRPWVERFLAGCLPLSFGDDLRERWWRRLPLQKKQSLLELRGRAQAAPEDAVSARALRSFLDRLTREIGRAREPTSGRLRVNELGRDALLELLAAAEIPSASRAQVVDALLEHWPYRNLDHLLAQVPPARSLRRHKSRLDFGRALAEADEGTLRSFPALPKAGTPRPVANPEVFAGPDVSPALHTTAAATFPTFEAYMDAALHDPAWGYYGHGVSIGSAGHFDTHPESLSPHYGRWLAAWAFKAWRDMLLHGEIAETDPFPIIEFGAGNGRLARDFLDALAPTAAARDDESAAWDAFAARVEYRIYETSAALRARQHELLGERAVIEEGDARRPGVTLKRDFPDGIRGFVLTNEVPDAFGVHKVLLHADGRALAALVVPRVEQTLENGVSEELRRSIRDSDREVRRTFDLRGHAGDRYLDAPTYTRAMQALASLRAEHREALLAGLWFEEIYVPVSAVPELAAHLRENAAQYATALAAEDSGVVMYVNVHADRFIGELGASLAAGFVVTIDYGDTTWGLVEGARRGDFPFRVYGDWQDYVPRPNDPYAAPGTQDMTADVNFTDLAHAGRHAGMEVVHYGAERDLTADELPALLLASAEQESLADFLGNPVFKVLVLGKRATRIFTSSLASALPLACREQDVTKARRHLILPLQLALSSTD